MTTPTPVDDLIRATLHAQARAVRDVGPLRLPDAAPAPPRSPAPRRPRRRAQWLAPLTAAAVVVCFAIALVTVRSFRNSPAIIASPTTPASSTSLPASETPVPEYYVAVVGHGQPAGGTLSGGEALVVGGTYTGKTVATLPSPPGITFNAVTAAADDRTFVLDAQQASGTRTWYLLRIAPGTANPARLTRLPIPSPSDSLYALALSASGQELALVSGPPLTTGLGVRATGVLQVYSVATGRLLHAWQTQHLGDGIVPQPGSDNPTAIIWAANDTAIAFKTASATSSVATGSVVTVRLFDLRSARSADWVSSSRKVLSLNVPEPATGDYPCYVLTLIPDGTGVACATEQGVIEPGQWTTVRWLEYSASSLTTPRVLGQERYEPQAKVAPRGLGGLPIGVYWSSPTGSTLLVATGYTGDDARVNFGIAHGGTFTPLPAPVGSALIAW